MRSAARITSIEFRNYKALRLFSVRLEPINVLVGPNNAGKSTIIGVLRILAVALRRARSKAPERVMVSGAYLLGYHLSQDSLPVSLENVHTDLADADTTVAFRLSNGNRLVLHFPAHGGCVFYGETEGRPLTSPTHFKAAFPLTVVVVPVLGPVEHEEPLVNPETVQRNIGTHRSCRNFRNFWYHNPAGWDEFADLVRRTWPGMDIQRPELAFGVPAIVVMSCQENRMTREIFWAGFGFQVWCQILTHISQAREADLVVVDEPEIYLHADLQRRLTWLLRDLGPDIVLATHSSEIVAEAEPGEVVLVDKSRRSAQRLTGSGETQLALDRLGSSHNMTLTQLARTRRVLFVEGATDFKLLRRFARKLRLADLAGGADITPIEVGAFPDGRRSRRRRGGWRKSSERDWCSGRSSIVTTGRPRRPPRSRETLRIT